MRPYGGLSWYLAGLSPTSAASLFAAALVNWERLAAGVTLDTMWLPVTPESSFCVGSVMWLMSLDVVLFALLTWYCDKVRVGGCGCEWRLQDRGKGCKNMEGIFPDVRTYIACAQPLYTVSQPQLCVFLPLLPLHLATAVDVAAAAGCPSATRPDAALLVPLHTQLLAPVSG